MPCAHWAKRSLRSHGRARTCPGLGQRAAASQSCPRETPNPITRAPGWQRNQAGHHQAPKRPCGFLGNTSTGHTLIPTPPRAGYSLSNPRRCCWPSGGAPGLGLCSPGPSLSNHSQAGSSDGCFAMRAPPCPIPVCSLLSMNCFARSCARHNSRSIQDQPRRQPRTPGIPTVFSLEKIPGAGKWSAEDAP